MTINEAIEILRKHNEWRRDKNFPSKLPMINPTILGKAIDFVVNFHNIKPLIWISGGGSGWFATLDGTKKTAIAVVEEDCEEWYFFIYEYLTNPTFERIRVIFTSSIYTEEDEIYPEFAELEDATDDPKKLMKLVDKAYKLSMNRFIESITEVKK